MSYNKNNYFSRRNFLPLQLKNRLKKFNFSIFSIDKDNYLLCVKTPNYNYFFGRDLAGVIYPSSYNPAHYVCGINWHFDNFFDCIEEMQNGVKLNKINILRQKIYRTQENWKHPSGEYILQPTCYYAPMICGISLYINVPQEYRIDNVIYNFVDFDYIDIDYYLFRKYQTKRRPPLCQLPLHMFRYPVPEIIICETEIETLEIKELK